MNIFATDKNPRCAFDLDDRRRNKMIVESGQLLCGAIHVWAKEYKETDNILYRAFVKDIALHELYKLTHKNHPCSVWTREHFCNWLWLFDYWSFLCHSYYLSANKVHTTHARLDFNLRQVNYNIRRVTNVCGIYKIQPVNCTSITFYTQNNQSEDVHTAYKLTLISKWTADDVKGYKNTWTGKQIKPEWFTTYQSLHIDKVA